MPDHDSNIPPGEAGVTNPVQPTPPAPSSRPAPTSSHYSQELPLPEELQAMLGGSYVVESFLGQGGMGAVYKGLQMPLRRPVAIKILAKRSTASGDEDEFAFEERFKREAYAMAALTHPNIVQVYDCGDAGESYLYISMELVEGGDLSDAIKSGQCTPEVALKLIPQICDGLQAAHERGLVHRDIKPANIFLTADGRPKVADFGLAKKFDAQSTFATKTGMAMGTPDYAAPEQYEAVKDIDHRADVYSLGVMMYQMLTGTLPRGAYRPPSQRAAVDPRLDAVVFKAMEHERSDRYQSVAEIKAELAAIAAGPARPAAVPTAPVSAARSASPAARAAPAAARAAPAPARPVPSTARTVPATTPKKSGMVGVLGVGVVIALAAGAWFVFKPKKPAIAPQPGASAAAAPRFSASSEPWVDRMAGIPLTNATREGAGVRFGSLVHYKLQPGMTDGAIRFLFTPGPMKQDAGLHIRLSGAKDDKHYGLGVTTAYCTLQLQDAGTRTPLGRTVMHEKGDFAPGQPVELELRAVGTRIVGKLNGRTVYSVDEGTLANGIGRVVIPEGTLVHGVQTLDLSKPAPALVAGAPNSPPSTEPWVDVLREYFALPVEKRNVSVTLFEPSPEGWKVNKRGAFNLTHLAAGGRRNVALRSTVRGMKDSLILALRTTGDDVQKNMRSYWAQLKPDGSVAIVRRDQTQPTIMTELSHSAPVPGFAPDSRHTFEFRAVEDVLTATLDGRALDPVRDTVCTNGGLSFTGNAGMIIEKLEMADLTAQLPAAGSSAAFAKDDPSVPVITGWKNVMASAKEAIPKVGWTGLKEDNGWLVATGYRGMASAGLDGKVYPDVALRGRVRGTLYVNFRSNSKLPGYYSARFFANGNGNITLIKGGSDHREDVLSKFRMNASPEHSFLVAATGPDIRFWVDGQLMATAHDTTITDGLVGIAIAGEGAAFRDLEVAELPADSAGKFGPVAGDVGPWRDGLAELLKRGPLPPHATAEGAGIRMSRRAGVYVVTDAFEDIAVRATARAESTSTSWDIALRSRNSAADCYMARLFRDGHGAVFFITGGKSTIHPFTLPAGFSLDTPHSMEFRAQGDRLTVLLDGREMISLRDSTHASGQWMILGEEGTHFEGVEYRELSPGPSPATVARGEERWIDGLAEWWASPKEAPTGWMVREAGGSRVTSKSGIMLGGGSPVKTARDVAVRAVVRHVTKYCGIVLRDPDKAVPEGRRYTAALFQKGNTDTTAMGLGKVKRQLGSFPAPPGIVPSDPVTFEFRIQGDLLTVYVNGTQTGSVRDSELREPGRFWFFADPDTLIEKLEYCVLEGAGDSAGAKQ